MKHWVVFILLLSLSFSGKAQTNSIDSTLSKLKLTNLDGEAFELKNIPINSLIILASRNSCTGCFDVLEENLLPYSNFSSTYKILIIKTMNDPMERREFAKRYSLFSLANLVLFDCTDSTLNKESSTECSLLKQLKIERTPALILKTKTGETELLMNETLFENIALSKLGKTRIKHFFKSIKKEMG